MKVLVFVCLLGLALSSGAHRPKPPQPTPEPEFLRSVRGPDVKGVLEIIAGLLDGFGSDMGVNAIQGCISDVKTVGSEVETAINDFKRLDFFGIKDGIHEVAEAFQQIPDAIKECEAIKGEVADELAHAIDAFKNPWSLFWKVGKSLLLNGRQIYSEITTAVSDWDNSDWFGVGKNIGQAMYTIFDGADGATPTPNTADIGQMVAGFLVGMGSDLEISQIQTCISDDAVVLVNVAVAYKDFKNGTFTDVMNGLKSLGTAFQFLPGSITSCTTGFEKTASDIEHAITAFKSPWSLVVHAGAAILVDGKNIYNEISTAVSDYQQGDWYNFGYYAGKAMFEIVPPAKSN